MGIRSVFAWAPRIAAVCGALLLSACGGGGSGGSMIPPPGQGTLKVSLTDGPACGFDHVYVTVDRARVHTSATAADTDTGWSEVVLNPGPQKIDLLTLTNGVLYTLGQTALPPGTYQQIRLVLAANSGNTLANSVVPTGGTEQPLDTPSGQQSGLKVNGDFTVQANTLADIVLDFDACKSIVKRGNGTYGLKPVITAIPVTVAGQITGMVTAAPGAQIYAERNGTVVKATVADANGNFTLSPIEQVTSTDTVDIVIVPTAANGLATGVIRGVPVVSGQVFSIGTVALPPSSYRRVSGAISPINADVTVSAMQTIGGNSYEIASTSATTISGSYGYSLYVDTPALPAAAPVFGDYRTMLPIPLSFDTGATGQYTIGATLAGGATVARQVNVAAGDIINIDFSF